MRSGLANLVFVLPLAACAGEHPTCYKTIITDVEQEQMLVATPCPKTSMLDLPAAAPAATRNDSEARIANKSALSGT
jgi:hypothetical protein